MNAVVRSARRIVARRRQPEKIDEYGATLFGDLPDGVRVKGDVAVSFRQIWRVRCHWFLKRHGRNQNKTARPGGELIQQPMIRRGEFWQARRTVQRFHLPELRDD